MSSQDFANDSEPPDLDSLEGEDDIRLEFDETALSSFESPALNESSSGTYGDTRQRRPQREKEAEPPHHSEPPALEEEVPFISTRTGDSGSEPFLKLFSVNDEEGSEPPFEMGDSPATDESQRDVPMFSEPPRDFPEYASPESEDVSGPEQKGFEFDSEESAGGAGPEFQDPEFAFGESASGGLGDVSEDESRPQSPPDAPLDERYWPEYEPLSTSGRENDEGSARDARAREEPPPLSQAPVNEPGRSAPAQEQAQASPQAEPVRRERRPRREEAEMGFYEDYLESEPSGLFFSYWKVALVFVASQILVLLALAMIFYRPVTEAFQKISTLEEAVLSKQGPGGMDDPVGAAWSAVEQRYQLTELADEAISTSNRASYDKLTGFLDSSQEEALRNAARSEVLRVQQIYATGSRLSAAPLPVKELSPAAASESDIPLTILIAYIQNPETLWDRRARAAYVLEGSTNLEANDALLRVAKTDSNLDVVKQAMISFKRNTGYPGGDFFDAERASEWWANHRDEVAQRFNAERQGGSSPGAVRQRPAVLDTSPEEPAAAQATTGQTGPQGDGRMKNLRPLHLEN